MMTGEETKPTERRDKPGWRFGYKVAGLVLMLAPPAIVIAICMRPVESPIHFHSVTLVLFLGLVPVSAMGALPVLAYKWQPRRT